MNDRVVVVKQVDTIMLKQADKGLGDYLMVTQGNFIRNKVIGCPVQNLEN